MNRDVFLSILAMDSYNRGYGAGVSIAGNTTSLGSATIRNETLPASSESVGFYASAYDWNGQTVISYRGTDPSSADAAIKDVVNGWSSFLGFGTNSQFGLARQFHQQVTGIDFPVGTGLLSNAIVTGHSHGGALAGYANDNRGDSERAA